MGLCRVHPISYIILIFVSRIVDQRLSYDSLYQVLLTSPICIPSCGTLAYGGLFPASPVDGAGL